MSDQFDDYFARLATGHFPAAVEDIRPSGFIEDGTTLRDAYSKVGIDASGFTGSWQRFITTGVYNNDFLDVGTVATNIDDTTNPVPFWTFAKSSGTAITASAENDTASPSGHVIRFTAAAGAAGDYSYIQQIVPIFASRGRNFGVRPSATFLAPASVSALAAYFECIYLDADKATIGSATSATTAGTTIGASSIYESGLNPGPAPSNAKYMRLRVGMKRAAASESQTGTLDMVDVTLRPMDTMVSIIDNDAPATYSSSVLFQQDGDLFIRCTEDTNFPAIQMSLTGGHMTIYDADVNITEGDLVVTGLVVTNAKAGTFSDSDFLGTATDGALGIDTTNDRIYFRQGGAWSYCAKTAGFEIPANETICPACLDPILADEAVVGKIDRPLPDGALHGLWVHFSCANRPLDKAKADEYWGPHGDLDRPPPEPKPDFDPDRKVQP